jgi:hypothetical protein
LKAKAHVRVARAKNGTPVIQTTARPSTTPLYDNRNRPLATIGFAVIFNVPDELFDQAQKVIAEIDVTGDEAQIVAEVKTV